MKKLILILIVGSLFVSCGAKIKFNPVEYYDKYGNRAGVDCEGVANGNASIDMCGVCDADYTNDCTQDCTGEWGGTYEVGYFYLDIDDDGLGVGDAFELCEGLDLTGWVSNNNDKDDKCYSNIHDCANVCDGQAFIDDCDNCVAGTTGLEPCSK